MKSKSEFDRWVLYYLILAIIQTTWLSLSEFPPFVLRMLMLLAVFAPLVFRKELIPFVFSFFMILRGNFLTAYSYLPDIHSTYIYIGILLLIVPFHFEIFKLVFKRIEYIFLIYLFIYMLFVDLLAISHIGIYTTWLLFVVLLYPFCLSNIAVKYLSLSFLLPSVILSIYYLIFRDLFMFDWSVSENIVRSNWSDPNYFTITLGQGFIVSLLLFFKYLHLDSILTNKVILISSMVLILIVVAMLASRGGFICILTTFVLILLFSNIKYSWKVLSIIGFIFIVLILYSNGIFDVILFRFLEQGNVDSAGGRTQIWNELLNNYPNQSFLSKLFGGGSENHLILTNGHHVHNEALTIMSDYGLFGLFLYLLVIIYLFFKKQHTSRDVVFFCTIYYVLTTLSLSPFIYIYTFLFLMWIFAQKNINYSLR